MEGDAQKDTVVVKYGSSCLATTEGISYQKLDTYAEQLAEASEVYNLVVVSSGSIAVGRAVWSAHRPGEAEPGEQSLATLGSARAVSAWQEALASHDTIAGQIEVTHHEIRDNYEGEMFRKVLNNNIDHGIISIINENDALSDEEIITLQTGGDNDGLASLIAQTLSARQLLLLTSDSEGLINDKGEVQAIVKQRQIIEAQSWATDETNELGRGGMQSKVQAAYSAAQGGVRAHIARAGRPIVDIIDRKYGTYFAPPH